MAHSSDVYRRICEVTTGQNDWQIASESSAMKQAHAVTSVELSYLLTVFAVKASSSYLFSKNTLHAIPTIYKVSKTIPQICNSSVKVIK